MTAQTTIYQSQNSGIIQASTLILFAFATAFFPRLLNSMGVPSPINFVHFAVVPLACGIVLAKTRVKDKRQIAITKSILGGLGVFFGVTIVSAIFNSGWGNQRCFRFFAACRVADAAAGNYGTSNHTRGLSAF